MIEFVSQPVEPEGFNGIAKGDQRQAVSWFSGKGDALGTIHQADFGSRFGEADVNSFKHGVKQQAKVTETHVPSAAEGAQNTNLSCTSLANSIFEREFQIGLVFFPWKRQNFRFFVFGLLKPFRVDGIHISNEDIDPSSCGRTHPIAAVCSNDPVFRSDEAIYIDWRQRISACKDDDLVPVVFIQGTHFAWFQIKWR